MSASHSIAWAIAHLKQDGVDEDTGHWQGVSTVGHPDLVTTEVLDLRLAFSIPLSADEAIEEIGPNIPWAEDHFQERVSRIPSNPGEQYRNWAWWRDQTAAFDVDDGFSMKFSHTYQERFWPKMANSGESFAQRGGINRGIRYEYGDLDDVVNLLRREPHTRQAYLPIFFPEDTGAVHGGRIPCTLGYHFLLRRGRLHCWYEIRSCDAVRHFRDDLYLACRLVQWVLAQLEGYIELREGGESDYLPNPWFDVQPGTMFFTAHSFHAHKGDAHLL